MGLTCTCWLWSSRGPHPDLVTGMWGVCFRFPLSLHPSPLHPLSSKSSENLKKKFLVVIDLKFKRVLHPLPSHIHVCSKIKIMTFISSYWVKLMLRPMCHAFPGDRCARIWEACGRKIRRWNSVELLERMTYSESVLEGSQLSICGYGANGGPPSQRHWLYQKETPWQACSKKLRNCCGAGTGSLLETT